MSPPNVRNGGKKDGDPGRKKPMVHSQAREIARHVLDKCQEEKLTKQFHIPLCRALDRAAFYTGLSKRLMSRIKHESAVAGTAKLKSPTRARCGRKNVPNRTIDDFERDVIARCIEDFYLKERTVPTCPQLLLAVRKKTNFPWGIRTLQRNLSRAGYMWRACTNKTRVLAEMPSVVHARAEYLRRIREYRDAARPIYYVFETWLDKKLSFKKCWQKSGSRIVTLNSGSPDRLIMIHAGSSEGLLRAASVVFKAGATSGDYTGEMSSANFEKWLSEKLLPSLPGGSVVVLDEAPYHCVQENKPPARSALRSAMLEWLVKNHIAHREDMRKDELYNLIETHRPKNRVFRADRLIWECGCQVLRLPPFMCNLNPIELAWCKVERVLREGNGNISDTSLTDLHLLAVQAVAQVTAQDWAGFDKHVMALEDDYWNRDVVMEATIDEFIEKAGGEVEDGHTSDDSSKSLSSLETDSESEGC